MLDLARAMTAFQNYTQQFEQTDPKIQLKLVHTMGVMHISAYLSKTLQLTEMEQQLAQLIALLHDIGRFEQLRQFNSFDDNNIDHAILALNLLQKNHFIRSFIIDDEYDEVIYAAIKNHNTFAIEPNLGKEALLQAQLIRDADKLDNFRVKEVEEIETLFDISLAELENETISPRIKEQFEKHHLILRADRQTHLDMWLSYIAFLYDLNFSASYHYLCEQHYVMKLFQRIQPKRAETNQQWQQLAMVAQDFLREKCAK